MLALIAYVRDGRNANFTITMWASLYPIGVMGIACTQIANDLDSPAFKGIASGILIIAVIHWIWLVIYTLPMIMSGELFLSEAKETEKEEAEAKEKKCQDPSPNRADSANGQVERRSNRPRASDETDV